MRAFLFVFDPSKVDRETVVHRVDQIAEITNWHAFFGNTMCLASEATSGRLSRLIREALPDLTFIVTEVDPQRKDGWLPKSLWAFLNEPRPASLVSADA